MTNEERVLKIETIFHLLYDEPGEEGIIDLLTDIGHYMHVHNLDDGDQLMGAAFERLVGLATMHLEEEVRDA